MLGTDGETEIGPKLNEIYDDGSAKGNISQCEVANNQNYQQNLQTIYDIIRITIDSLHSPPKNYDVPESRDPICT